MKKSGYQEVCLIYKRGQPSVSRNWATDHCQPHRKIENEKPGRVPVQ
jgi:hypothetical protein